MGMNKRRCPGVWLLCIFLQIAGGLAEWQECIYDFTERNYQFSVHKSLDAGAVLGQVVFNLCELPVIIHYVSEDPLFEVQTDGSVIIQRHLNLHGERHFLVHAFSDRDILSSTTVTLRRHHDRHKQAEHAHHSNSERGLRRQKRDWVVPPISVPENQKGNFPKRLVQIKSSHSTEITVAYSLTGPGADVPPVNVFSIDSKTGWLNVNEPLDREKIPDYTMYVHAVSISGVPVEKPIDINVKVTDQNDNRPVFTSELFEGTVPEGCKPGTPVMNVSATDLDDSVDTANGIVTYSIIKQEPELPHPMMFTMNLDTGLISAIATGLDREKYPQYTLTILATDSDGIGYSTQGKAVITVTDTNDNPPIFDPTTYTAIVPENEVGFEVVRMRVTDADVPETDAWWAVCKIIKGNEANVFNVSTTEDNMCLLKTIKGLDFEVKREYILSITVTNKAEFSVPLTTSTATVTVTVTDMNEAPIFEPKVKTVSVSEDSPMGQEVASYTAQDPDRGQNQKITYYIGNDPAGWLSVNAENGIITGNGQLDRESMFVKNNTYKAVILAVDNGNPAATGTGTLQLILLDVNDNGPVLEIQDIIFCQKDPNPVSIPIIDRDQTPFTDPFMGELSREARENWTASVVNNLFEIRPSRDMDVGVYSVAVTLADSQGLKNTTMLKIQVCYCEGYDTMCQDRALAGGLGIPVILGILGGILALLILLLLLLLFLRRKKVVKEPLLPPEDDTRDNVYCYDEEGGGEEDQDFDLGQLHRGLDARPDVTRNDVVPTLMPAPQYRPRPANPDEIGNFIDENLNAADNDPTAPPYDSLLVFDYEGSGSEAASLSSLNSSNSDADQDYTALNDWGPRFRKLADMYGGDED